MSFTSSHIGQRVRAFRELKGLTQQQLELELDASFGHISKIESGKVNPTKETLLNISRIMWLSQREEMLLLGINWLPVNSDEVQAAIELTSSYITACPNPIYLCDDLWFMWSANAKLLGLMGLPDNQLLHDRFIQQHRGTHMLEIFFNPQLGRQLISLKDWEYVTLKHCVSFIRQIVYDIRDGQEWLDTLLQRLREFAGFDRIWQLALTQSEEQEFDINDTIVPIEVNGKRLRILWRQSVVNTMPRFSLIEYHIQIDKL
jgi:transcriptional regulator with XRE-family HTH domain